MFLIKEIYKKPLLYLFLIFKQKYKCIVSSTLKNDYMTQCRINDILRL